MRKYILKVFNQSREIFGNKKIINKSIQAQITLNVLKIKKEAYSYCLPIDGKPRELSG